MIANDFAEIFLWLKVIYFSESAGEMLRLLQPLPFIAEPRPKNDGDHAGFPNQSIYPTVISVKNRSSFTLSESVWELPRAPEQHPTYPQGISRSALPVVRCYRRNFRPTNP